MKKVILLLSLLLLSSVSSQCVLSNQDKEAHVFRILFLFYPNTEIQNVSGASISEVITKLSDFTNFYSSNTNTSLSIIYEVMIINRTIPISEMANTTIDGQIRYWVMPSTIRYDIESQKIDPKFYESIIAYYGIRWPYVAHGGISYGARGYFGETGFCSIPIAPDNEPISDTYTDFLIEVAVHEFLHVIDDMYESSGDSSFYNPDQMSVWTNYTKPYDYYKWMLNNWPTEKWLSLEYGLNAQLCDNKILVNTTISFPIVQRYESYNVINVSGKISPAIHNLKAQIMIYQNITWELLNETSITSDGLYFFSIQVPRGNLTLKVISPETEKTLKNESAIIYTYYRLVPASNISIIDPNTGEFVQKGKAGSLIQIDADVRNIDFITQPFVSILQIKDPTGATIFINCFSSELAAGQSSALSWFWIPTYRGNYTLEILVVKNLFEPIPYSDKVTSTLVID